MVAPGSRTMIAGSLSSCIAGFHQILKVLTIIEPETLIRWHTGVISSRRILGGLHHQYNSRLAFRYTQASSRRIRILF